MSKLLTFLLVLVAAMPAFGQKVDLDRGHFVYEYRDLPHKAIDPTFRTFSVMADASGSSRNAMSRDVMMSKVNLEGYDRADFGDIRINIRFDDIIIDNQNIKEHVSERKGKDDVVTKTYSYTIELNYTFKGRASAVDKNGSVLVAEYSPFSSTGKKSWTSQSFKTNGEASSYYYNNKSSIINNLANERINEALEEINHTMNYNMGFPTEKDALNLWIIGSKKHPEYAEMQRRWEELKPVLQSVTANEITKEQRNKVQEAITYFEGLKTKYADPEDKGEKKIRYAAFYNIALLYILMDEADKAIPQTDGLIANDYDPKDGKHLREKADNQKELFALNKIRTHHFPLSQARPYEQ